MVYTWDIPNYVISHTYFEIYLVYDTLCPIPGISRNMSGISFPSHLVVCLEYVRDIPDKSFPSHSGICQGYSRHMSLSVKRPGPTVAAMRSDLSAHSFGVSWVFNVTATVQRPPAPRPQAPPLGPTWGAPRGPRRRPRPGPPRQRHRCDHGRRPSCCHSRCPWWRR